MKPTHSLLLTLLLLAAGCANPVEEKVTATWPDGSRKEVHLTEEGLEGHEIQQFHANGKLHVRGRLVDGQRDGLICPPLSNQASSLMTQPALREGKKP